MLKLLLPIMISCTQAGPGMHEQASMPRRIATPYGRFDVLVTVETFGAGGVAGNLRVTRHTMRGEQALLKKDLTPGSGVALIPGNKGFVVFDVKFSGREGRSKVASFTATRYDFAPSGLHQGKPRTFIGDYSGDKMWHLFHLPFPKDRWGLVYA